MASTATLTSLAILKVNIDEGQNYLDYLRPFVLHVLAVDRPDQVTDLSVKDAIQDTFGLNVPHRTIQIVLKRIARDRPPYLTKRNKRYHITGILPDAELEPSFSTVETDLRAVVQDLVTYGRREGFSHLDEKLAEEAVCLFLSRFDITCLKAYLQRTALPDLGDPNPNTVALVSKYVIHLQDTASPLFSNFIVMVQGHMLANALLCPDLEDILAHYRGVVFYLDTPLVIDLLGLHGEPAKTAAEEMVSLVHRLEGTFAIFSHTRDEVVSVIRKAAEGLGTFQPSEILRFRITAEALRTGRTKSDLLLASEHLEKQLETVPITIRRTPQYLNRYQIDEERLESLLTNAIKYFNPVAKTYDINSIRSIYVLREGKAPRSLEKSRAVLVTNNTRLARVADRYGGDYEEDSEVSSVITDFSLANVAWLKAPVENSTYPKSKMLAYAYVALEPSPERLEKYLKEIDRLEQAAQISAEDHQLLRSAPYFYPDVLGWTIGSDPDLSMEPMMQTVERVKKELRREEADRHNKTKAQLRSVRRELEEREKELAQTQGRIAASRHLRSLRKAKRVGWSISTTSVFVLGFVLLVTLGTPFGAMFSALLTLVGLVVGPSLPKMHRRMIKKLYGIVFQKEKEGEDN